MWTISCPGWGRTYTGIIVKEQYADGSTCFRFMTENCMPLATLSVCIPELSCKLSDGEFFVKNYADCRGLPQALIDCGFATAPGGGNEIPLGPFDATVVQMWTPFPDPMPDVDEADFFPESPFEGTPYDCV